MKKIWYFAMICFVTILTSCEKEPVTPYVKNHEAVLIDYYQFDYLGGRFAFVKEVESGDTIGYLVNDSELQNPGDIFNGNITPAECGTLITFGFGNRTGYYGVTGTYYYLLVSNNKDNSKVMYISATESGLCKTTGINVNEFDTISKSYCPYGGI